MYYTNHRERYASSGGNMFGRETPYTATGGYPATPYDDIAPSMTNLTHHSVHLSPEELAAIDHGIMSTHGNGMQNNGPSARSNQPLPAAELDAGFIPAPNGSVFNLRTRPTERKPSLPEQPLYSTAPRDAFEPRLHRPLFNPHTPTPHNRPDSLTPPQTAEPAAGQTKTTVDTASLVRSYEERIEAILRQERERHDRMEAQYRAELDTLRRRLDRQDDSPSERQKLERLVYELRQQIRTLEEERQRWDSTSPDFDRKHVESDYEQKMADIHLHYDRKIANLVRQFEQEKLYSLDIMKTRVKAEMNLLVPKIRQQCQAALERPHADAIARLKSQASSYIRKMRDDFGLERQVLVEQLRRRHEQELLQMQSKLQSRYEMKLLQEKNALERRFLEKAQARRADEPLRPRDDDPFLSHHNDNRRQRTDFSEPSFLL